MFASRPAKPRLPLGVVQDAGHGCSQWRSDGRWRAGRRGAGWCAGPGAGGPRSGWRARGPSVAGCGRRAPRTVPDPCARSPWPRPCAAAEKRPRVWGAQGRRLGGTQKDFRKKWGLLRGARARSADQGLGVSGGAASRRAPNRSGGPQPGRGSAFGGPRQGRAEHLSESARLASPRWPQASPAPVPRSLPSLCFRLLKQRNPGLARHVTGQQPFVSTPLAERVPEAREALTY